MVILGLCAAARPWKPFSCSSCLTVIVLKLLAEAVWNLLVSVATEDRWFLHATCFRTRRSRSVSLCGLSFRGWDVVVPRCFHFTITALTVDRGSSIRAEIWWTDLLERWHPMTVPHWKSLSSSVGPFYSQYLSMEIAWLGARFYTPVKTCLAGIAKSTHLKGCSHTTLYMVYLLFSSECFYHFWMSLRHFTFHCLTSSSSSTLNRLLEVVSPTNAPDSQTQRMWIQ